MSYRELPTGTVGQVLKYTADGNTFSAEDESVTQDERPGLRYLFSQSAYNSTGTWAAANEIQYVRVYLQAGFSADAFEFWQDTGATANARFGIYDQATPASDSGTPNSRVAQTGIIALDSGDDVSFVDGSFTTPYVIPVSGYYWIAMTFSKNNTRIQSTATQATLGFWPVYYETGAAGPVLPASAGTLVRKADGVGWVGVRESV